MKYLICCFLLFFNANQLFSQKNRVKLCLHDNPKLSASYHLTYYWWDPYHIHIDGKVLDPDGVKKDYYLNSKPPYDYCFYLKSGRQKFKVASLFNDSITFDLELRKDTSINFQDYVKDYYVNAPDTLKLLQNLLPGDKLTVHFSYGSEGLRLDLLIDEESKLKIIAVNRKKVNPEKDLINYKNFIESFNEIETAAQQLKNPAGTGYVITIRKNRLVKEYKGKNDSAKISLVFTKIKNALYLSQNRY